MRQSEKLTALRVQHASSPGRYGDGHGLFLQVGPTGAKSWLFRYTRKGRERWMGLGPYPTVTLAGARDLALECRKQLKDKTDPLDARQVATEPVAVAGVGAAAVITFSQAAEAFHAAFEAEWENRKHAAQVLSSLRAHAFPTIGDLPVGDIGTEQVLSVLRPIWRSKTETATRIRGRIERILDYAAVRGWRDSSAANPARWVGHLKVVLPNPRKVTPVRHFSAVEYTDMPQFWRELAERTGVAAAALRFAILTASRTGTVRKAKWSEVDFDQALWRCPPSSMKTRTEHTVPLTRRAIELLRALPREVGNPHIFIGPKPGTGLSENALLAVLARMGWPVTGHGMRASFKTWARSETEHAREIVEEALAHALSKLDKAYSREEATARRRRLMDEWAMYCSGGTPPLDGDAALAA